MSDPLLGSVHYLVEVLYKLPNGQTATYAGRWLARNPARAEERARGFVYRFLRPAEIIEITIRLST